jgi:dephospho-CoA kinase
MTLKIGLTGNIGSGKSIVSEMFKVIGIPIYSADEKAKHFLNSEEVKIAIASKFGNELLSESNEIDKDRFAKLIFNNKENLDYANSLIHPLVMADFEKWCKEFSEQNYVLMESAIIFESHLEKLFDKIVVVYCPKELRLKRVMGRDKVDEERVLARIKNQLSDNEKNKLADFIIQNDDTILVIPQVIEIDKKIKNINSHVL